MNQEQRRRFLIEELLRERPSCRPQEIPRDAEGQKILLRGLLNVRHPAAIGREFLNVQDAYLREELAAKTITVHEIFAHAIVVGPPRGLAAKRGCRKDPEPLPVK